MLANSPRWRKVVIGAVAAALAVSAATTAARIATGIASHRLPRCRFPAFRCWPMRPPVAPRCPCCSARSGLAATWCTSQTAPGPTRRSGSLADLSHGKARGRPSRCLRVAVIYRGGRRCVARPRGRRRRRSGMRGGRARRTTVARSSSWWSSSPPVNPVRSSLSRAARREVSTSLPLRFDPREQLARARRDNGDESRLCRSMGAQRNHCSGAQCATVTNYYDCRCRVGRNSRKRPGDDQMKKISARILIPLAAASALVGLAGGVADAAPVPVPPAAQDDLITLLA